jgi:hypothetical protein
MNTRLILIALAGLVVGFLAMEGYNTTRLVLCRYVIDCSI